MKKQLGAGVIYHFLFAVIFIVPFLVCGCSRFQVRTSFDEANDLFGQGNYEGSLKKYERIMERYPSAADRALFEMGVVYSHPRNERKDYQKAVECFQRLIRKYPESPYRSDSEKMIFYISNVPEKDRRIAMQQVQIEALQRDVQGRGNEVETLRKKIDALEQKVLSMEMEQEPADKILIKKKDRRLSLMAKGKVLKSYRIALGGNPNGPKEQEGDNKTPEGIYCIDARNKDSCYHISLHISYPNERDKKRARELRVSPGGDIMIHGVKNGYASVGKLQANYDWTKGCIAVTDEEIEEIERLVPNGTTVEIRP